ncbi:MAG: FAD-binding oxidoreductase [Anaerolineae bacterium]|nr:FAD-binding oxidoreductase [Anaerolineae bacterium]
MTQTADIIIIGGGVIGCSTAYNLAEHGAGKVILLERGSLCSGGTAKSCAIVRTHYSIPTNLIHAVESLNIFANFNERIGGDVGWRQTGYLIVGPEAHRDPMLAVFQMQNAHGIDTAVLTPEEALEKHPLLHLDDVGVIGYDTQAGYADPYLTTMAYAQRARALGVTIHQDTAVTGLQLHGGYKTVQTTQGLFTSPVVIMAAGPWTHTLGQMIGVQLPYEVSRHKVITLKINQPYQLTWPIVKDLTTPDKIYFRPETGGVVLVGTGDHGDPIVDPDSLTDHVELDHVSRIDALISHRMPLFAEAHYVAGWSGPYDITPDWNPIVGHVPGYDGLYVAVGFSGHGFKLSPTIGESLAQTVLGQPPRLPIADYALSRFSEGRKLSGAYGIGSIS